MLLHLRWVVLLSYVNATFGTPVQSSPPPAFASDNHVSNIQPPSPRFYSLARRTSTPVDPQTFGQIKCNAASNGHYDVEASMQARYAHDACPGSPGHMIVEGKPQTNIHQQIPVANFVYGVWWIEGCKSTVTQMDAGFPGLGMRCENFLVDAFTHCNNGGAGGTITVGCLAYQFSVLPK